MISEVNFKGSYIFDYSSFKVHIRNLVHHKLRDYGFLSSLHIDFRGNNYPRRSLGTENNRLLFDLIFDTLIVLNKYNEETNGLLNDYKGGMTEKYFTIDDLGGFIKGDLENNQYRQLFKKVFASGLPMSRELCKLIIDKLISLNQWHSMGSLKNLIDKYNLYYKVAPKTGGLTSVTSTHSVYFMLSEVKTYQIFEMMKITKGLCPFTCSFFGEGQLNGDASPGSTDQGVVRAHLEGNSFFANFYKFIENGESSIWKTSFKFMLAPLSAQPHYNELHGHEGEDFFNLIIQARMYHLYQLAFSDIEFSIENLKQEFMTKKLSDYIFLDRAGFDSSDEIFIWAPLVEENGESSYGFEFDSLGFSNFIQEYKKRLDDFNSKTLNLRDWFINSLGQSEFFENYVSLVERVVRYSWLTGESPDIKWNVFGKVNSDDAWEWLIRNYCVINQYHEVRLMSIFDLLEPYCNLKLQ